MAINYIEKGYGLHQEISRQGHSLSEINGVWMSSNDDAVQAIIDNYTAPSIYIEDIPPQCLRRAFIIHGISMLAINNAIANLSEPNKTNTTIDWEYSVLFNSDNSSLTLIFQQLNITSEQINTILNTAAALKE